jgi:peptide/nickel transport system substrate-binding protein
MTPAPNGQSRIKVTTRNTPPYRDPAVILIDQLKEIYIEGELEPVDTPQWYPKVQRKDYTVALNLTGTCYQYDDKSEPQATRRIIAASPRPSTDSLAGRC